MWIGKVATLWSRKKNRTTKVDRLVPKAMPGPSQRVGDNAFHLILCDCIESWQLLHTSCSTIKITSGDVGSPESVASRLDLLFSSSERLCTRSGSGTRSWRGRLSATGCCRRRRRRRCCRSRSCCCRRESPWERELISVKIELVQRAVRVCAVAVRVIRPHGVELAGERG